MEAVKPRYERPVIVRHALGRHNKFGALTTIRPVTEIDGVPVAALLEAYGSPLFVFSEKTLRARYRELRDELALRFSKFSIAWSYKTNYLDAVCRVFHQEGALAEVVSGMEFDKARRAGVPGPQILFNGPGKTRAELQTAFREGVHVHIDHFDELALRESVAEELGVRPKVGIRVNLSELPVPQWNRFGFNLESGSALGAVERILRGGRLELAGLHCHLGTFILDPDAYRLEAARSPPSPASSTASTACASRPSISAAASPRTTRCTRSTCRARRSRPRSASTSRRSRRASRRGWKGGARRASCSRPAARWSTTPACCSRRWSPTSGSATGGAP